MALIDSDAVLASIREQRARWDAQLEEVEASYYTASRLVGKMHGKIELAVLTMLRERLSAIYQPETDALANIIQALEMIEADVSRLVQQEAKEPPLDP